MNSLAIAQVQAVHPRNPVYGPSYQGVGEWLVQVC